MKHYLSRNFHLALIPTLAAILSISASCTKKELVEEEITFENLKVPEGFDWSMRKPVSLSVGISDPRFGDAIHVVCVYDQNGSLIAKGAAKPGKPFETSVSLPIDAKRVYLIKTAPDGSRSTQELALSKQTASTTMSASAAPAGKGDRTFDGPNPVSPDCSTGVDETVIVDGSALQMITVSGGKTVALCGTLTNKRFWIAYGPGGGTLRVCGTDAIIRVIDNYYTSDETKQKIVVTSSGSLILADPQYQVMKLVGKIINYGTITLSTQSETRFTHTGTLENYGTINSAYTTAYLGKNMDNYGTINGYDLSATRVTNHRTLTVSGSVSIDTVDNFCTAAIYMYPNIRNFINRAGSWGLLGQVHYRQNVKSYDGSYLKLNYLAINESNFNQVSGSSVLEIPSVASYPFLSDIVIDGNYRVCSSNAIFLGGIQTDDVRLKNGANLRCDMYIPPTACNAGYGTYNATDTDQDGVVNALDDFPDDATRAFITPGASGTLLFEDMWPDFGDSDMNDAVIGYAYSVVTNASNVVTQVIGDFKLRAAGAIAYRKGFGVEFPVDRGKVMSTTGTTLETGQSKAVAIVYTNAFTELGGYNTRIEDSPPLPAKNYHIELIIKDGPTISSFGLSSYNPFLMEARSTGNSQEIHLMDHAPTNRAYTNLFGTRWDISVPNQGQYYRSYSNRPWAFDLPITDFNYTYEGKTIAAAYPNLFEWARTGGTTHTDWYTSYVITRNLFGR